MTDRPIGVKAKNSAIGKKLALDYVLSHVAGYLWPRKLGGTGAGR